LLQKEFWNILEFFLTADSSDIEIHITTNLNSKPDTVKRLISVLYELIKNKKIKKAIISCSLDCWGPQAEFLRFGLNLQNWQNNFEYLLDFKWLRLEVHSVITSLSLPTAQLLQDKISQYKKSNSKIIQSYHLVDMPQDYFYHPNIFDNTQFSEHLTTLLNTFPCSTTWDSKSKDRLNGVVKLYETRKHDPVRLLALKNTLNLFDQRRNTNWRSLFPEIDFYFNTHNI
jgi:hypothetical protein